MKQINAIGDACPLPVVKAKKGLAEIGNGQLEVLVDNDVAVQNIRRFAESEGCRFDVSEKDGVFHITLLKEGSGSSDTCYAGGSNEGKTIVVLSSDTMGSGDEELGRILMKGFVFALTQLDTLPGAILLYNTGARLSAVGSASLQDLIALEKAGVTILTCGTCLNHFGIAEQLGVGEVTNMYHIVEEMRGAARILRP